MTQDLIRYFSSSAGKALLAAASEAGDPLRLQTALRKQFAADYVIAAMEQVELRSRAAVKFSRAADMLFDRAALEQASAEVVATHRAQRFATFGKVADICCGLGGDAIALSRSADVTAVDIRPERSALCIHNGRVHDVDIKAVTADAGTWLPSADALFFDPSRRESGRREVSLAGYAPSVDLARFRGVTPHIGIKVAPGLPHEEIPQDCEAEFISVNGECRELALWFGNLRSGPAVRATCLPSGETLTGSDTETAPVGPIGAYAYEPDRAIIRAHLINTLANGIGARKLSTDVAYLASDDPVDTPFARRFVVSDVLPFNLKRLQTWLRERAIGRLEIKKRRFPMTPDEVRKGLKLAGKGSATLLLTRLEEKPVAIVCDLLQG